jgi:hypothetical protein
LRSLRNHNTKRKVCESPCIVSIATAESSTVGFLRRRYRAIDINTAIAYRSKLVEFYKLLLEMDEAIQKNASRANLINEQQ